MELQAVAHEGGVGCPVSILLGLLQSRQKVVECSRRAVNVPGRRTRWLAATAGIIAYVILQIEGSFAYVPYYP